MDAETEPRPRYHGWRNYETWAVNLWLSNTEPYYLQARSAAREREPKLALRNLVEDIVEGGLRTSASIPADMTMHALSHVDWDAIVAAFKEE